MTVAEAFILNSSHELVSTLSDKLVSTLPENTMMAGEARDCLGIQPLRKR